MTSPVENPPAFIELMTVLVGGLSGAVFAVEKKFVVSGVVVLAISTGLGGGIIRDVLLADIPAALTDYQYLLTALVAAALGYFFTRVVQSAQTGLMVFDAVGLGLFAVIGAQKALTVHLPVGSAIFLGTIASTGGWVLRDILSGDTPELVQPGPLYGLVALVASATYVLGVVLVGLPPLAAEVLTITMTLIVRLLVVKRGWKM